MLRTQLEYTFIFIALFSFISCGTQKAFDPHPDIQKKPIADINQSINTIRKNLSEKYLDSFISKDEKNLFVYTIEQTENRFVQKYFLAQYDITSSKPRFIKYIVENSDYQIHYIHILPKNKIIYLLYVDEIFEKINIIDYKLNKMLRTYDIEYSYPQPVHPLVINKNQNSFTIDIHTIDISDIYQDIPNSNQLFRDNSQNIVIDPINNLIWEDTENVINKLYTLQEADTYCKSKPPYNWRLPTIHEMGLLMQHQIPFSLPFVYYSPDIQYWLKPKHKSEDISWKYLPEFRNEFFYYDNIYNKNKTTGSVRCVSDFQ